MELIGAIEAHFVFGITPMSARLRHVALATRDELESGLGGARTAELAAIGSLRPVDEVVHRVRNAPLAAPWTTERRDRRPAWEGIRAVEISK